MKKFLPEKHADKGYGKVKNGFGDRPALLLIDFQKGVTAPNEEYTSQLVQDATNNTVDLLDACREKDIPAFYTVTAFREDKDDTGKWKLKSIFKWTEGSEYAEVDERLEPKDEDYVITKKAGSAFVGTHLLNYLITKKIDTILLTGLNTSGCIRATANDAHAYGFSCIIPSECVGDATCEDADCSAHKQNLIDLNARYSDVVALSEVLDYVNDL